MAKSYVFVLHGIGEYSDGWMDQESTAVTGIRKAAPQYPFFQNRSLDEDVEFVPVLYDDVFHRVMKHWANLAESLEKSIPIRPEFLDRITGFLSQADDDEWWAHTGADVLLYWGFKLFRQRVILRVLAQIADKVRDTISDPTGRPSYHILAHSLGTAVTHDALHHLGTESWLGDPSRGIGDNDDGPEAREDLKRYRQSVADIRDMSGLPSPFAPSFFTFSSVTMLSNTSSLIYGIGSPYQSIVRPGSSTHHGAYTNNYLNVNHQFDPISAACNFQMPAAWQQAGAGGADIALKHLVDVGDLQKIHSASYYCAHPSVHLPLLQLYVDGYFATDEDISLVNSYRTRNRITRLPDDIKDQLTLIKNGQLEGFVGLIDLLKELKDVFDE